MFSSPTYSQFFMSSINSLLRQKWWFNIAHKELWISWRWKYFSKINYLKGIQERVFSTIPAQLSLNSSWLSQKMSRNKRYNSYIVQLFEDTLGTLFGLPKWPFLLGKGLKNNAFSRFVKIDCIPKKFLLDLNRCNFQEIAGIIILSVVQIDLCTTFVR